MNTVDKDISDETHWSVVVFGNGFICDFVLMAHVSVRGTDVVHHAREKEKAYYPEQNDTDVVQPYAAFGPAGHAKVHLSIHFLFLQHHAEKKILLLLFYYVTNEL